MGRRNAASSDPHGGGQSGSAAELQIQPLEGLFPIKGIIVPPLSPPPSTAIALLRAAAPLMGSGRRGVRARCPLPKPRRMLWYLEGVYHFNGLENPVQGGNVDSCFHSLALTLRVGGCRCSEGKRGNKTKRRCRGRKAELGPTGETERGFGGRGKTNSFREDGRGKSGAAVTSRGAAEGNAGNAPHPPPPHAIILPPEGTPRHPPRSSLLCKGEEKAKNNPKNPNGCA